MKVFAICIIAISVTAVSSCTELGGWDVLTSIESRGPWEYRVELTIASQGYGEILTDLPVRVAIGPDRLDHDALESDAGNLAFYPAPAERGVEPLSHEVAHLDAEGTSEFWVRLPTLPRSGDVKLWLYYGGDELRVPEKPADVWRASYVSVLHFEDDDASFNDSSGYGTDAGVPAAADGATEPDGVAGLSGAGLRYREATDKIVLPARSPVNNMAPVTLSLWMRPVGDPSGRLFSKGDWFVNYSNSNERVQIRFQHGNDGDANDVFGEFPASLTSGTWHGIATTWNGERNGGSLELYLDGSAAASITRNSAVAAKDDDSSNPLGIGNLEIPGGDRAPDAVLDEIRIARTERSAAWVDAEHLSVTGGLVTVGKRERLW